MKIAVGVEYDGAAFHGWQSQRGGGGVQDAVEQALSAVAAAAVRVNAAGRTDAGVHAALMPAHFTAPVLRQPSAWVRGANTHLPPSVRLLWAKPVADEFHARHRANRRHYQYLLLNRAEKTALWRQHVGFSHLPLDVTRMQRAATQILGRRDFSAFRAAACQAKSPVRELWAAQVERRGDLIVFDFCGNGFLHHMVRNIIGTLLFVGCGRQPPEWVESLMAKADRNLAPPTAAAAGLYFCGAEYPTEFNLPATVRYPKLF